MSTAIANGARLKITQANWTVAKYMKEALKLPYSKLDQLVANYRGDVLAASECSRWASDPE